MTALGIALYSLTPRVRPLEVGALLTTVIVLASIAGCAMIDLGVLPVADPAGAIDALTLAAAAAVGALLVALAVSIVVFLWPESRPD